VVTTRDGVAGLTVNNGEHYLGSDDSDGLALMITQLLNQPWRMRQLSDAARQFVSTTHDWSVAAAQLEAVHARLSALPRVHGPHLDSALLSRSAE